MEETCIPGFGSLRALSVATASRFCNGLSVPLPGPIPVAGRVGMRVAGHVGMHVAGHVGMHVAGRVGMRVAGRVGMHVAGRAGKQYYTLREELGKKLTTDGSVGGLQLEQSPASPP